MIFINFKTYEETTGDNALNLIKKIDSAKNPDNIPLILVLSPSDIKEATGITNLEVWSQKIDPITYGSHTGGILPEAVLQDGATGVILNHSEDRSSSFEELKKTKKRADEVGLKTLIFAKDLDELTTYAKLHPDYLSYEPPSLIGSTSTSVSQKEPQIIREAIEITNKFNVPLIVGAGIATDKDIRVSLQLGATGFAIATSIVKSSEPNKALENLLLGYEK